MPLSDAPISLLRSSHCEKETFLRGTCLLKCLKEERMGEESDASERWGERWAFVVGFVDRHRGSWSLFLGISLAANLSKWVPLWVWVFPFFFFYLGWLVASDDY